MTSCATQEYQGRKELIHGTFAVFQPKLNRHFLFLALTKAENIALKCRKQEELSVAHILSGFAL